MRKIVAILAIFSCSASAADFSARVAQGNEAIATPEGKIYDASLAPAIQAAMVACVPPGSASIGKLGKFILVGYANASGHIFSVAVNPATTVSRCFADKFGSTVLPPPPSTSRWGGAYPVTVEMTVTE
ncbi:hypothetical protein [Cognatiluteimonas weifangensis]|uniref:hypothetical protein n=1 Tax=Cognatiluteimonas weifangensis TaxID=2303539 RepID=UPI0011C1656A|nr:hypothetical protein [Luteimonas weifangensis]